MTRLCDYAGNIGNKNACNKSIFWVDSKGQTHDKAVA